MTCMKMIQTVILFLAVASGQCICMYKLYDYIVIAIMLMIANTVSQEINPSGTILIQEGDTISFNCTNEGSMQPDIVVQLNGQVIPSTQELVEFTSLPNGASYTFGPVTRDHNGSILRCWFVLLPVKIQYSPDILLNVVCELSNKFAMYLNWNTTCLYGD